MSENVRNVVIIGSGCSGLTAAIYAARANLNPLIIDGHEPGGQLAITTLVENFPGFPEGIQGPELIDNMRKQAERFGAEFRTGMSPASTSAEERRRQQEAAGNHRRPRDHPDSHVDHRKRRVGALARPAQRASLIGHGVSSCATCDGFFFSGKEIAVIGGGDSAMEEALFLTRFATKVTLIHRRERVPRLEDHAGPRRASTARSSS